MGAANRKYIPIIICFILAFTFLASCDSEHTVTNVTAEKDKSQKNKDNIDSITKHYPTFYSSGAMVSSEKFAPELSPLENEINQLSIILDPYLDPSNPYFVGEENIVFIKNSLLNPDDCFEPIAVADWRKLIQLLFNFGESDKALFQTNIFDYASNGTIERQYAISGLMKLLSTRYPLSLDGDYEKIINSEILTDLDEVEDSHQMLIRKAYCLGFTDYTLDDNVLFRPNDPLSKGEGISILYRILNNFGLPVLEDNSSSNDNSSKGQSTATYSVENILEEYVLWLNEMRKSNNPAAKKRTNMFIQAKGIIVSDIEDVNLNEPLAFDDWIKILNEVFGIDMERIEPFISYETGGILPYDIAAITISDLLTLYGGFEIRDASDKDLENARNAISQFDTARDINKFAKMFSSGFLDGLYQIPGFTPQRPVNKAEALLLIKRIIETIEKV